MKLTKKKVLYYNILKWQYFYDHPSKTSVDGVEELREIQDFIYECALCEYYKQKKYSGKIPYDTIICDFCPLSKICPNEYHSWSFANTPKTRKKYAGIILEACKKMKVKDL